jgi:hypothetical protein
MSYNIEHRVFVYLQYPTLCMGAEPDGREFL